MLLTYPRDGRICWVWNLSISLGSGLCCLHFVKRVRVPAEHGAPVTGDRRRFAPEYRHAVGRCRIRALRSHLWPRKEGQANRRWPGGAHSSATDPHPTTESRRPQTPRASRSGRIFASVSVNSKSGSESGMMPAPANRRRRVPDASPQRRAIANSPSPAVSTQPTGPE